MQIILKDKDERNSSWRANPVCAIIYTGKINEYIRRKCIGESGIREDRIWISRRVFIIERIQWRRQRVSQSGWTQKDWTERKDNIEVHSKIQKSSKGK